MISKSIKRMCCKETSQYLCFLIQDVLPESLQDSTCYLARLFADPPPNFTVDGRVPVHQLSRDGCGALLEALVHFVHLFVHCSFQGPHPIHAVINVLLQESCNWPEGQGILLEEILDPAVLDGWRQPAAAFISVLVNDAANERYNQVSAVLLNVCNTTRSEYNISINCHDSEWWFEGIITLLWILTTSSSQHHFQPAIWKGHTCTSQKGAQGSPGPPSEMASIAYSARAQQCSQGAGWARGPCQSAWSTGDKKSHVKVMHMTDNIYLWSIHRFGEHDSTSNEVFH